MARNQKAKSVTPILVDKVDELLEFVESASSRKPAKKTKPKATLATKGRAKK